MLISGLPGAMATVEIEGDIGKKPRLLSPFITNVSASFIASDKTFSFQSILMYLRTFYHDCNFFKILINFGKMIKMSPF